MDELPDVHVIAINITKRLVVSEEGLGDIRNFLDEHGDDTDSPDGARWCVVEWRFGGWTSIVMDEYHAPAHGLN